jgi:hypothetical protein
MSNERDLFIEIMKTNDAPEGGRDGVRREAAWSSIPASRGNGSGYAIERSSVIKS